MHIQISNVLEKPSQASASYCWSIVNIFCVRMFIVPVIRPRMCSEKYCP